MTEKGYYRTVSGELDVSNALVKEDIDGFGAAPVSAEASDDDLAARLWERSAEVVGLFDEVYA